MTMTSAPRLIGSLRAWSEHRSVSAPKLISPRRPLLDRRGQAGLWSSVGPRRELATGTVPDGRALGPLVQIARALGVLTHLRQPRIKSLDATFDARKVKFM